MAGYNTHTCRHNFYKLLVTSPYIFKTFPTGNGSLFMYLIGVLHPTQEYVTYTTEASSRVGEKLGRTTLKLMTMCRLPPHLFVCIWRGTQPDLGKHSHCIDQRHRLPQQISVKISSNAFSSIRYFTWPTVYFLSILKFFNASSYTVIVANTLCLPHWNSPFGSTSASLQDTICFYSISKFFTARSLIHTK